MTAVIYARYSSDNQREESIEGQIRDVRPMPKGMASPSSSTIASQENSVTRKQHICDMQSNDVAND